MPLAKHILTYCQWIQKEQLQGSLNKNIFFQGNAFEDVVCNMSATLLQSLCINICCPRRWCWRPHKRKICHYLNQCWFDFSWITGKTNSVEFEPRHWKIICNKMHLNMPSVRWRPFSPGLYTNGYYSRDYVSNDRLRDRLFNTLFCLPKRKPEATYHYASWWRHHMETFSA